MCEEEVRVGINDRSSGPEKIKPACEKHKKKLQQLLAVTFRKGVTPWLPFRLLGSMVAPDWIGGLLVAC